MHYDFDTVVPRQDTGSLKWDAYGDRDVLPFWVADMDFAIAPEITQALRERVEHPIYGYTQATDRLYDALTQHLIREFDWPIEREWLVWIPGVVSALSACCRAYLAPGDHVMTNPPIYHHFFTVHDQQTQTLIEVPLSKQGDRWTYDLVAMEQAITPETRMMMLCSPHNPAGTVFEPQELQAVCALAEKHNIIVVSDEVHNELVLNESIKHMPTVKAAPHYQHNIVTLMSQSKTYNLAGMNCAFAIIPNPALRKRFSDVCFEVVPGVTTFAYESARAAFESGVPWRNAMLDYLRSNFKLLSDTLNGVPGLHVERCDATYLAWIDASGLGLNDATAFFEERGVGLSGGEQFGRPGYVRFNFACPRSTLQEGLDRMVKAVSQLSAR